HMGDYVMTGTIESTLAHYPDNFDALADLGVGDPRWDGMTALFGAIISNQPSVVKFMIEHGAKLDVKNRLGWTPLMMCKGVFMANSKKEFHKAAALIRDAMIAQGLKPE